MINFEFKTSEIADLLNGELIGDFNVKVTGISSIETAKYGEITFLANIKYEKYLKDTEASCVIVAINSKIEPKPGQAFIKVNKPYESFVNFLIIISKDLHKKDGYIHPSATISQTAQIDKTANINSGCYIGENVKIGSGTVVHPNVCIEANCVIGNDTVIYSNVTIYSDSVIGDRCILHAGSVIGSDGFGNLENEDGSFTKIPQIGNTIIGDDAEIGANATIDRATFGSTIIGNGVKIDNLVHIAHNCEIGDNTAIAALTGLSGSVKIGKRNRIAGQVGIVGHIYTADDVIIYAQSGVSKSLENKGIYFGAPAMEHIKAFRKESGIRRISELIEDVKLIKKKLEA